MNSGIYIIISPTNGRYIGSSTNLKKRFNRYKNLSCQNQYALYNSLKKYGVDNHTIKVLYYCDKSELLFWERIFADLYLSLADYPQGLNIRVPGYNDISKSLSKAGSDAVKAGCKKRWDNPEERRKTSERARKALQNKETIEKIRAASVSQWDDKARKNKSIERINYFKNNPEAKQLLIKANKAYFESNPKAREKSNKALIDYYDKNPQMRSELKKKFFAENPDAHWASQKVINTENDEIFASVSMAAKYLGISREGLRRKLKGIDKNNTTFKYL